MGFSKTGCPLPDDVAWRSAWSIRHFERPGIISCSSDRLKLFAKMDNICCFVCHVWASLWALTNTLIRSNSMSKCFRFDPKSSSFNCSPLSESHRRSSCPGLITDNVAANNSLAFLKYYFCCVVEISSHSVFNVDCTGLTLPHVKLPTLHLRSFFSSVHLPFLPTRYLSLLQVYLL